MRNTKVIPIKTIQIVVDDDLYYKLKAKKGKRNWYRFMHDIVEDD